MMSVRSLLYGSSELPLAPMKTPPRPVSRLLPRARRARRSPAARRRRELKKAPTPLGARCSAPRRPDAPADWDGDLAGATLPGFAVADAERHSGSNCAGATGSRPTPWSS